MSNRIIKNIVAFIIFLLTSQLALAEVVELDNQNIAHCKEQLSNDDWTENVILLYVKGSPETEKFRALYEQVSIERPQRHLFALAVFDPKADAVTNQLIMTTVRGCLTNMMYRGEEHMGNINANTPAVLLYDYLHAKVGLESNGLWTKDDILKFIQDRP